MRLWQWVKLVSSFESYRLRRRFRNPLAEDTRSKKTRPPGQGALNPQQLVPLGRPLAAGKGPDFQLAGIGRDRQVTDERIFRLARTGADDGTPARFLRQLDGRKRLGNG